MSSTKVIRRRESSGKSGGSSWSGADETSVAAWSAARNELTLSIQQAALCLGISTSTAYRLADQNRFPVPILRVGGQYKVPSRPLLQSLGLDSGSLNSGVSPDIENVSPSPRTPR